VRDEEEEKERAQLPEAYLGLVPLWTQPGGRMRHSPPLPAAYLSGSKAQTPHCPCAAALLDGRRLLHVDNCGEAGTDESRAKDANGGNKQSKELCLHACLPACP